MGISCIVGSGIFGTLPTVIAEYGSGAVSYTHLHKELEQKISQFFGMEDAILYASCFDANGGLFETILTEDDAVISDELNHASIIDGVRLCKAKRYRYKNNDMADLEQQLIAAEQAGARIKLIATDGVFSMDGIIANLDVDKRQPISGLVQIPCIERNAVAAMRAINALSLANFLTHTRKISFDVVIKTMYETGRDLFSNCLLYTSSEKVFCKKTNLLYQTVC